MIPDRGSSARGAEARGPAILLAMAGLALWLPHLLRWTRAWSAAPDQAYGWGVPVLAAFLLRVRWQRERGSLQGGRPDVAAVLLCLGGLALAAADLVVLEANALWPTAQFLGAAGAIAATAGGLAWVWGWRAAGRLIFPFIFLTTALTWPTPVKTWVVATLSGANARLAAEFVSAAGYPAVVNGNVIAVRGGLVGIEEACSGMRSLQAIWMVAWFAGEFFLLNGPRRVFLVVAAIGAALVANLGRTVLLTWLAAKEGLGASERWHEAAGNLELAAGLLAVAALALRARRGQRTGAAPSRARPVPAALLPLRPAAIVCLVVVAVMVSAEGGTRGWYRMHEAAERSGLVHWRLVPPTRGWTSIAVPPREREVLGSSDAEGLTAASPVTEVPTWVFLVNWEGDAARSENPEWHDPAVCLPAAGAYLLAELGTVPVGIGGRSLPSSGYRFQAEGRPVIVYFCHWDAETARARTEGGAAAEDYRARRWQRVREGRRQGDVAHIAFVFATGDAAEAVRALQRWAPGLLHPVAVRPRLGG